MNRWSRKYVALGHYNLDNHTISKLLPNYERDVFYVVVDVLRKNNFDSSSIFVESFDSMHRKKHYLPLKSFTVNASVWSKTKLQKLKT